MRKKTEQAIPEMPQPGALASCDRCGVKLRVSESRREDSAPFRRSLVPKGVCPDCVMTQFLYSTYPINMQLDERGPQLLLHPAIREAFLSSGIMERCEMSIDEVNWERVVANWNLPVNVKADARNPYRMGDAKRFGPSKTFGSKGFFGCNLGSLVVRRDPATGKLMANGEVVDGELGESLENLTTLLDKERAQGATKSEGAATPGQHKTTGT